MPIATSHLRKAPEGLMQGVDVKIWTHVVSGMAFFLFDVEQSWALSLAHYLNNDFVNFLETLAAAKHDLYIVYCWRKCSRSYVG